jgi:hypothetical protein
LCLPLSGVEVDYPQFVQQVPKVPFKQLNVHVTFCSLCIIIYQYSKTNVMHFLFSILRIKGLYMF